MRVERKLGQTAITQASKNLVIGVLLLLLPLTGCLGMGDLFQEKRFIAGNYFLDGK
jgi:hypothetical protein